MSTLPLIASLGAGRMGRGIAHAFAYAGYEVALIDLKARSAIDAARVAQDARTEIDASLTSLAALGVFDDALRPAMLERVTFVQRDDAPAVLARTDFAFEGVPETLEAKRAAFSFACTHLRPDAIVSSTTSTMLVTMLAEHVTHP